MRIQIKVGDMQWCWYLDSAPLLVLFLFLSPRKASNHFPFSQRSAYNSSFLTLDHLVDVLVAKVYMQASLGTPLGC
jgi:hypothetical protein